MSAAAEPGGGGARNRWLFALTIFAGSFLLFLVQPMIARMALPRLGGAPAVWNSAMLVYQALLLGGYAYAHGLGHVPPRAQAAIHLAVLAIAALALPIGLIAATPSPDAQPALWVPWLLGLSIGPLFFAVSAQAPLMQRWFAAANPGQDPYALYAASNFGSFSGLIAYPLIVEPALSLGWQSMAWSIGYTGLAVLVLLCATRLPQRAMAATATAPSVPPSGLRIAHWIMLAFVPSGLMLATSTYITTDIVAMPLLWVLPLGLYLLSFSIAFAANRIAADILTRIAPITILLFGGIIVGGYQEKPYLNAGLALALLFMAAVALHTAMYRLRPEADRLTGFYLAMSFGGVLGGVFCALIAPVVFDWTWEYPLLVLAAGALIPQVFLGGPIRRLWQGRAARWSALALVLVIGLLFVLRAIGPQSLFGPERPGLAFAVVALIGMATIGDRRPFVLLLIATLALFGGLRSLEISLTDGARTRSYFGVYSISADPRERMLAHGTTIHGLQLIGSEARERTPTMYYARGSGVGDAIEAATALYGPNARIGVVGLGAGTLACYAQAGQDWRFYEIDPAVIRIARDTGQFSYLRRCSPDATIRIGDARLSLAREAPASRDLLALDAFSSDAVPMHLLTREAFATYGRVLSSRGVLLVHISNRFLDLEPVVSAAAVAGGWRAARLVFRPSSLQSGASLSVWIAMSRDPGVIATLAARDPAWEALPRYPGFTAWTDDYATILPLLKGP